MKLLFFFILMCGQAFGTDCLKIRESEYPDNRSFNIVFVSSGFETEAAFEELIRGTWSTIEKTFEPLAAEVSSYNIFILKASEESFCTITGGLLDCQHDRAVSAARECFSRDNKVVFTVHNSGGVFIRGNTRGHHVMISNHPNMKNSIAHELGHALFSLADEYDYGGPADQKNCSATSQCTEWKDLIEEGLATCIPGCKNKASFIAGNSIMTDPYAKTYGHNNQRLICCSFKKKTGEFPGFCDQYRNIGAGLEAFCGK